MDFLEIEKMSLKNRIIELKRSEIYDKSNICRY